MRRSSQLLPGGIHRRTKLTSAVYDIQPFPQQQCARSGQQCNTVQQVNRVTGEIRKCFEQKKYCSAVFIAVAEAFDKVWHEGLMYKIKLTLPSNTHNVLQLYLTGR